MALIASSVTEALKESPNAWKLAGEWVAANLSVRVGNRAAALMMEGCDHDADVRKAGERQFWWEWSLRC